MLTVSAVENLVHKVNAVRISMMKPLMSRVIDLSAAAKFRVSRFVSWVVSAYITHRVLALLLGSKTISRRVSAALSRLDNNAVVIKKYATQDYIRLTLPTSHALLIDYSFARRHGFAKERTKWARVKHLDIIQLSRKIARKAIDKPMSIDKDTDVKLGEGWILICNSDRYGNPNAPRFSIQSNHICFDDLEARQTNRRTI